MKLEDARRRVVEEELKAYRNKRRSGLRIPIVGLILTGILLASMARAPEEWAKGDWFKPGGWMYDTFGYAGGVLFVRAAFGLVFLGCLFWLGSDLYALSNAAAERRRAKVAAEQPRFRQLPEDRQQG